jgi:hypothetical protein
LLDVSSPYYFFVYFNRKMLSLLIFILFLHQLEVISSTAYTIGVISNVSLVVPNTNSSIINGTCNECLCTMLLNATPISALNCFRTNNTCEIFSSTLASESFSLMASNTSSFYFFPYFIADVTSTTTQTTQSTSSSSNKYSYLF